MSFFDQWFRSNEKNNPPKADQAQGLEEVKMTDTITLPRAFADQFPDILKTARHKVKITATPSETFAITDSKFGHYPCLPKGYVYPTGTDGKLLYPLAQINLRDMPPLEHFPASGYLQFYIGTDDLYGMSFDENIPASFKVLFFEESEVSDHEQDLQFLDEVINAAEYTPVHKPHRLQFKPAAEYVGMGDYHGEKNTAFNLEQTLDQFPDIREELEERAYELFSPTRHKLGGYAYFAQEDPRNYARDIQDYILLFQMDSDEEIMWGDAGVGNFFIHPADLVRKDFSKVVYNWDCS